MSGKARRLRELLEELFQYDRSDLDFGIYRILNQRRDEIQQFLDERLITQIQEAFAAEQGQDATLRRQLEEAEADARGLDIEPDQVPKVLELRGRLADGSQTAELADEVCADLDRFFRRYYQEGDFLSLRRYRSGTYAVPYEGEEVLLHWANRDQYYIKSSESLSSYGFTLPDKRVVRFRVVAADEEGGGFKPAPAEERRFALAEHFADATVANELTVRFVYASAEKGVKQADLNAAAAEAILGSDDLGEWRDELAATVSDSETTLLARHLARFTTRNSYDYFIHKDLGGFLRRELDTFIKNEVLRIDEVETLDPAGYDRALARVRVVRRIGHEVIDFLAQVEEFQKRVWLKQKLVVDTRWLISVERFATALLPLIALNDAQRRAWVRIFGIDRDSDYSEPLGIAFLETHPGLVVDTQYFDPAVTAQLVGSLNNIDNNLSGVIVQGDSFQAAQLLRERFSSTLSCVYLDPPYNTGSDGFLYKDAYRHSSWLTMIENRVTEIRRLMEPGAALFCSIDDNEAHHLRSVLDRIFPADGFVEQFVWIRTRTPAALAKKSKTVAEFILAYENGESGRSYHGIAKPVLSSNPLTIDSNNVAVLEFPAGTPVGVPDSVLEKGLYGTDKTRVELLEDVRVESGVAVAPFKVQARFRWSQDYLNEQLGEGTIVKFPTVRLVPAYEKSDYGREAPPNLIDTAVGVGTNEEASAELARLFGNASVMSYPKPVSLIRYLVNMRDDFTWVGDFFAGSGTTAHAVIERRRAGADTRFVIAEISPKTCEVAAERLMKAAYASEWKNGIPQSRDHTSLQCQYLELESYDDALDSVQLKRTSNQMELLTNNDGFRGDYIVRYMLEAESERIQADVFAHPDQATIEVTADGIASRRRPDLVATFNWLIGLRVDRWFIRDQVTVIAGRDGDGLNVLVLWRDAAIDSDALEAWFGGVGLDEREVIDVIYVNGDCTLERLRLPSERWTVRLLEEEFGRRMFERADLERAGG